jgi:hypothetical protein
MIESITVKTFRTRLEAESAGGLLTAAGIPFVIQSSEGAGMGPLSQGTSLLVRPGQAQEARRVLAEAGLLPESK